MSQAAKIDALRTQWDRAVERDRPNDAIKALAELEKLDGDEPRWAQRLGEAYRRVGKAKDAEDAFVRAMDRFLEKGFLPRAIAMAKLVAGMNPARASLLAQLDPAPAAALQAPHVPPPLPVRPVPLERAPDANIDEVRFSDIIDSDGGSSIQMALEDVSDQIELVDDITLAGVTASLPPAQEPSIDRLATMAAFRLFAGLSREALVELSGAAELVEFVPSAMVIVRDEPAFALYAIVGGTARVLVKGSGEIRLREGDVFGEGCLLDEGLRQADVKAETELMTLRISKSAVDAVTSKHPEVADALFTLLARRLLVNLMHTSPLFTVFEPKVRLELAQMFEVRRADAGIVLTQQGRRSDGLYVLLAGHLMAGEGGNERRVARGTAFGHASLMGAAADETVRATTSSIVLRLPAARFASLAAHYPPALAHLSETAMEPLPQSLRMR